MFFSFYADESSAQPNWIELYLSNSNPIPFYLNILLILNNVLGEKKTIFDYQWMTKMHLRVSVVEFQYGRPPDIDPASLMSTHSF